MYFIFLNRFEHMYIGAWGQFENGNVSSKLVFCKINEAGFRIQLMARGSKPII